MQDDQVAGSFAPDRSKEDPEDLEYYGLLSSDSSSEDDPADEPADAGAADQGSTCDPSFERFLDEWSDDENTSKIGDSGADSHP